MESMLIKDGTRVPLLSLPPGTKQSSVVTEFLEGWDVVHGGAAL